MPKAYVLINTVPEVEEEFLQELKRIEGVKEATSVYGIYDFVAKVEADSLEKVKEVITWKIRRLKDIKSSITLISVEDWVKTYFIMMKNPEIMMGVTESCVYKLYIKKAIHPVKLLREAYATPSASGDLKP